MKVTVRQLRKIIKESLDNFSKAHFIGTENPEDLRSFDQIINAYKQWSTSEDGRKLLTMVDTPEARMQADDFLDIMHLSDPSIPPNVKEYQIAYHSFIVAVGNIIFSENKGLKQLLDSPSVEDNNQGEELFNVLAEHIDELDLGIDLKQWQKSVNFIKSSNFPSGITTRQDVDTDTAEDYSLMHQARETDDQNNNVGLYLLSIPATDDMTQNDINNIWLVWFQDFLNDNDNITVIGSSKYNNLNYLVLVNLQEGEDVNDYIESTLNEISIEHFFEDGNRDLPYFSFEDSVDMLQTIEDPDDEVYAFISASIANNFKSLKLFLGSAGLGIGYPKNYSPSKYTNVINNILPHIHSNKGLDNMSKIAIENIVDAFNILYGKKIKNFVNIEPLY